MLSYFVSKDRVWFKSVTQFTNSRVASPVDFFSSYIRCHMSEFVKRKQLTIRTLKKVKKKKNKIRDFF